MLSFVSDLLCLAKRKCTKICIKNWMCKSSLMVCSHTANFGKMSLQFLKQFFEPKTGKEKKSLHVFYCLGKTKKRTPSKTAVAFLQKRCVQTLNGIQPLLWKLAGQIPEGRTRKFNAQKFKATGSLNVPEVRRREGRRCRRSKMQDAEDRRAQYWSPEGREDVEDRSPEGWHRQVAIPHSQNLGLGIRIRN